MILRMRQEEIMKLILGRTALWISHAVLLCVVTLDQAFAGIFKFTPAPPAPTPTPIPEIDGPGAIAAIALLGSVAAIVYQKMRK